MSAVPPSGYWTLVAGFLAECESPNTRAAYRRDLTVLGVALDAGEPRLAAVFDVAADDGARAAAVALAALSPDWWQAWRDGLAGRVASRRRRVAGARAFCRWWSRLFALENPVRELRPPGGGELDQGRLGREVVALTPAAARRLCEAAARPGPLGGRDLALIEVLYGCGLRASEAAGLDLSACVLDDERDPFVLVRGKGDRRRTVAVPRGARAALVAYIATGRPQLRAQDRRPRAGQAGHRDADAVFVSARGRRLARASIWRIVNRVARRAGLLDDGGRVFPHALRHSCGTHLIQSGIDIRFVQVHLGHASPVTTEIYTHVTAAHLREDFDRAHPRSRAPAAPQNPFQNERRGRPAAKTELGKDAGRAR